MSSGIIKGSSIGPASFVVNSGDLKAITPGNCMCRYADDTYLIIPSANEGSRMAELVNVESWSQKNNLVLNRSKSLEIIFTDRIRRKRSSQQPSTIPQQPSVIYQDSWSCHIQQLICLWSCQQHHNLKRPSCAACTPISWHVGRMHPHYLLSDRHRQAHHASSTLWGFTTARQRLEAVIRRGVRSDSPAWTCPRSCQSTRRTHHPGARLR